MADFRKRIVAFCFLVGAFAPLAAAQSTYTVTDLGTLSGSNWAKVAGINKSGQIVGTSADHAFLWSNGVMTDLARSGEAPAARMGSTTWVKYLRILYTRFS